LLKSNNLDVGNLKLTWIASKQWLIRMVMCYYTD
jgi:hypothetical protein